MKTSDLVAAAIGNTFRSKTRTTLTVIAIFIGAFTLAITSGLGTGINRYITETVASIGAGDVMSVTKTQENTGTGPVPYDPQESTVAGGPLTGQAPGSTLDAISAADLDTLRGVDGVTSVEPTLRVQPDYVEAVGGTPYRLTLGGFTTGTTLQLAAGEQPVWNSAELELALPTSYVDALGFATAEDAVGQTVTIGVTDAQGVAGTVDATLVGISDAGLGGGGAGSANDALTTRLYDIQSTGLTDAAKDSYAQATVRFDESTPEGVTALKDRLAALGYDATTVEDQIGVFKTVIDGIVLVLNAFAVIALLAAGFGIVNTLLMSVQERTREIGLMKAMGMGGGKVFGLFSLEAVFIGFLGSAIGVGLGMLAGWGVSGVLSGTLLADLPGLTLIAFDPVSILTIILVVMGIAFLAGTIPALRAARQDPIESLRYE
ncbi:ABC transporter permease [Compostimonas suwonensis]|uniref:Putative ABC transport system permease protein n=1 Tax=Compostimonas suwonensis TaxID=1048394 RepID=A0A2M9C4M5_9MICO|nr:ABC transporter permease [Compostimonas suwonensis]PJJ65417.1 putative ABC transport system permease protein [Compostimonas suwonensis]